MWPLGGAATWTTYSHTGQDHPIQKPILLRLSSQIEREIVDSALLDRITSHLTNCIFVSVILIDLIFNIIFIR